MSPIEPAISGTRTLRADAARNVDRIRAAAIDAFRGRGLGTPLEDIAATAGVSKATIYNRFGGRHGLVDAVIGELVASRMYAIMDEAGRTEEPWDAIAAYVRHRRTLLYEEPAFTDALLMAHPGSPQLVALAEAASDATRRLVDRGHAAGVLRAGITAADVYWDDVAAGLALRELARPSPEDHARRTDRFLDGLRAR